MKAGQWCCLSQRDLGCHLLMVSEETGQSSGHHWILYSVGEQSHYNLNLNENN